MDKREKGSRKCVFFNYFHGIPQYIVNLFFHTCTHNVYIFITYLQIRSNMLLGLDYGVIITLLPFFIEILQYDWL